MRQYNQRCGSRRVRLRARDCISIAMPKFELYSCKSDTIDSEEVETSEIVTFFNQHTKQEKKCMHAATHLYMMLHISALQNSSGKGSSNIQA